MQHDFWHQCWENNTIGFNQDDVHPFLIKHFAQFYTKELHTIFVPFCGKTIDMLWLQQFGTIDGAELSQIACHDFYRDHNLSYQTQTFNEQLTVFNSKNITLWQGDIFNLTPQIINKTFDCIYDRAALIALPKLMRQQYVNHLKLWLTEGTQLFLVSLEYPATEMSGPPFSVPDSEVKQLFADCDINLIDEIDLTGKKFAQRLFNVTNLIERLYIITKK
jgi:thiopurine S-methyltransferase